MAPALSIPKKAISNSAQFRGEYADDGPLANAHRREGGGEPVRRLVELPEREPAVAVDDGGLVGETQGGVGDEPLTGSGWNGPTEARMPGIADSSVCAPSDEGRADRQATGSARSVNAVARVPAPTSSEIGSRSPRPSTCRCRASCCSSRMARSCRGRESIRLWRWTHARPMPQQDCLPQRVALAVLHRLGQVRY